MQVIINKSEAPEENNLLHKEIISEVRKQPIFWSDDRNEHWFFDFKHNGYWVSGKRINNELTEVVIDIFK